MRRLLHIGMAVALALVISPVSSHAWQGPKPVVPGSSTAELLERAHTLRKPRIPAEALNSGVFGTVAVRISVAPNGEVLSARAVTGPPTLREAAVDAAREWEFRSADAPDNTQGFLIFRFEFGETYAAIVGPKDVDRPVEPPASVATSTSVPPVTREPGENDVVVPIIPARTLPSKPAGKEKSDRRDDSRAASDKETDTDTSPIFDQTLINKATRRVSPQYPATAANARIEGVVVVEVLVNESGKVESAKAISGPAVLREAAASAARQWMFTPARRGNAPAKAAGRLSFNFKRS